MRKMLALIVLSLFLFTSCNQKEQQELIKTSQNELIYTQLDSIYDHSDVVNTLMQADSLFDFCEIMDVKQYKVLGEANYTVVQTTKGLFIIFSDKEGNYPTLRCIEFSSIRNKEKLANLTTDMSLDGVRSADPDGQYDFLYHNRSDYPQFSYHFFEDGDCFCIRYEQNEIVAITRFTL